MRHRGLEKLIDDLIAEVMRGIELLEKIDLNDFVRGTVRSGSPGEQFRHNLDFLNSFLNGIADGVIDYERREREPRVETDKIYAAWRFAEAIDRLRSLKNAEPWREVKVRSELDPGIFHSSSLSRELEFVLSHTMHHHALIAEKLDSSSVEIAHDFGVAPSTLKYWRREGIDRAVAA